MTYKKLKMFEKDKHNVFKNANYTPSHEITLTQMMCLTLKVTV